MQNAPIPLQQSPIRENRAVTGEITLTQAGKPVVGQDVIVRQTKHQMLFGSTWGESAIALENGELTGAEKAQTEERNARYLDLFNMTTLPFYWARFEPVRGHPDTRRMLNTAR